jgi:hypothetical protein
MPSTSIRKPSDDPEARQLYPKSAIINTTIKMGLYTEDPFILQSAPSIKIFTFRVKSQKHDISTILAPQAGELMLSNPLFLLIQVSSGMSEIRPNGVFQQNRPLAPFDHPSSFSRLPGEWQNWNES